MRQAILPCQGTQGGKRDVPGIDFKKVPQGTPSVTSSEAIRA
jgi:hypothetical protein